MSLLARTIGATLALALSLVACSSVVKQTVPPPTDDPGSDPGAQACDFDFDVSAKVFPVCWGNATAYAAENKPRSRQTCVAALRAPGSGYTPELLRACSQAFATSCDDDFAASRACDIPRGTLANGSPCRYASQCAGGDCRYAATTSSCGVCVMLAAPGEACGEGAGSPRCAPDAYCRRAKSDDAMGTCEAYPDLTEGAPCDGDCGDGRGLYCDMSKVVETADHGACAKRSGAGKACKDSYSCSVGLACVKGACSKVPKLGEPCADDDHCAGALHCTPAKLCALDQDVAPGEKCGNAIHTKCAEGRCNYGTANFRPATPDATGICPKIVPDGADCDLNDHGQKCAAWATCIAGKCGIFDAATCK